MGQNLTAAVTRACEAIGSDGEGHGGASGRRPRYELFHAANSICSQKVRVVLAHHGLPYVSHTLDLFRGQTYLPDYVRLRMLGCLRYGGELVSRHSGSTSTAGGGCDGAVVPTLVDWETASVLVDSKRISIYLDDRMPERDKLRPGRLAAAIDEDLDTIDNLPNYQMLMGRAAKDTDANKGALGSKFSERKVAWCDHYLSKHFDDEVLMAAYTAKRAKELSAAEELFSLTAMTSAYARAKAALVVLETKLAARTSAWLYGDTLTMADLFWGIELLRMKSTGMGAFWEGGGLPHVERFFHRSEQLAEIRTAIIDWPGAMF